MNLDRVTITGADDSVRPKDLAPIARDFRFVEWGILASANNMGRPRFPSLDWLQEFALVALGNGWKTSIHLCGRWVRDILMGRMPQQVMDLLDSGFGRVQLNFHAERNECDASAFSKALKLIGRRQFIFQID